MSQSTTLSTALTAAQLAAMNAEQIVKMGRELIAQLGDDPDAFHGNIWPGNIHLDDDGMAVLGQGCDAPVSARTPEQIEYMAPEAFWQNEFSRSADLYSIAMVMYAAYNGGCLPFTSSPEATDLERAQALRTRMKGGEIALPESVSEAVGTILRRALGYNAADRYLTADAMMRDLGDTDEALPSEAPDGEQAVDLQAASAAAATGMTGVSVVAELAAIPRETVRPVEAAAGVSASSILMEKELHDLNAPSAEGEGQTQALKDIFAEPVTAPERAQTDEQSEEKPEEKPKAQKAPEKTAVPVTQKSGKKKGKAASKPAEAKTEKPEAKTGKPEAKAGKPEAKAGKSEAKAEKPAVKNEKPAAKTEKTTDAKSAPKKQYTVQKDIDRRQEAAAKRKNRSGAAIAIGVGAVVIAGLVAVAAYSLGAFEKEEPLTIVTAEPVAEVTAEPTAEPTSTPVVPDYHFKATAIDFDWDELENVGLAVLDGEEALDAAVEAAEAAGLENVWLGARWLDAADAPNGEAGWYWLDDTQLPETSAFWADGEPAVNEGGRLMLSRAQDGSWRFRAVTRAMFDEGEFAAVGCITDGNGMAAMPTPTPEPTPEATATPEAETETESPRSYTYYAPSVVVTAAPTAVPTAAPSVTAAPTATPTVTAEPTATPAADKYTAARSSEFWTALNEAGTSFVTIASAEELAAVTDFLNAYNEANEDAKLENVWLGAQYQAATDELEAGWYWLDGTPLSADDANWADGQSEITDGCLMLRYADGAWKYYAVTEADFSENAAAYPNAGVISPNAEV